MIFRAKPTHTCAHTYAHARVHTHTHIQGSLLYLAPFFFFFFLLLFVVFFSAWNLLLLARANVSNHTRQTPKYWNALLSLALAGFSPEHPESSVKYNIRRKPQEPRRAVSAACSNTFFFWPIHVATKTRFFFFIIFVERRLRPRVSYYRRRKSFSFFLSRFLRLAFFFHHKPVDNLLSLIDSPKPDVTRLRWRCCRARRMAHTLYVKLVSALAHWPHPAGPNAGFFPNSEVV
ncbi:unnamed protein product [Ixodes pacificus]